MTARPVRTLAAFARPDGRRVMVAEEILAGAAAAPAGGEAPPEPRLVLMVEATAGAEDWQAALGPFAPSDLMRHAEAAVAGQKAALTEPQGHRAMAMLAVALMGAAQIAVKEPKTS